MLGVGVLSGRRTKSQLLTFPKGSGMYGCVSSWRHSPSTMNLYWWYLGGVNVRRAATADQRTQAASERSRKRQRAGPLRVPWALFRPIE